MTTGLQQHHPCYSRSDGSALCDTIDISLTVILPLGHKHRYLNNLIRNKISKPKNRFTMAKDPNHTTATTFLPAAIITIMTQASSSADQQTEASSKKRSAAVAFSLEDTVLQHRLTLGTASKGGARGTVTRCAIRLGQYVKQQQQQRHQQQEEDPNETTNEKDKQEGNDTAETTTTTTSSPKISHDDCIRELQFLQLELGKRIAMLQRQNLDTQALVDETTNNLQPYIAKEQDTVQTLEQNYQTAMSKQSHQMEYETLAQHIVTHHPTSSKTLHQQLDDLKQQIQTAQRQQASLSHNVHVRKAQFHLLLQSMMDLQQSLDMNDVVEEDTTSVVAVAVAGGEKTTAVSMTEAKNDTNTTPMEIDKSPPGGQTKDSQPKREKEEGELYGDL